MLDESIYTSERVFGCSWSNFGTLNVPTLIFGWPILLCVSC